MKVQYTKDENGQYYFEGTRMLVSHIRGGIVDRYNPRNLHGENPYEPLLIREWYDGPVGTVIAIHLDDKIRYGFSKVNQVAGDRYDRDLAIKVALNRALFDNVEPPFDGYRCEIKEALEKMFGRAKNYYKFLFQQPPAH